MNLAYLRCEYNQLTSLNLGNNTNLSTLILDQNPITNINIANNTGLRSLWFSNTAITSLDVSPLSNLEVLSCWGSPITELDLSANPKLTDVYCFDTPIQSLNLANGHNDSLVFVWIHENPDLECVQVDDEDYSNTNWISGSQVNEDPFIYDSTVVFSEDCAALGLAEITESHLSVYPNPANDFVTISITQSTEISIYNMLGDRVSSQTITPEINQIDLSALKTGVYFIQAENSEAIKLIKQ